MKVENALCQNALAHTERSGNRFSEMSADYFITGNMRLFQGPVRWKGSTEWAGVKITQCLASIKSPEAHFIFCFFMRNVQRINIGTGIGASLRNSLTSFQTSPKLNGYDSSRFACIKRANGLARTFTSESITNYWPYDRSYPKIACLWFN